MLLPVHQIWINASIGDIAISPPSMNDFTAFTISYSLSESTIVRIVHLVE
jgi:hypothetical protein